MRLFRGLCAMLLGAGLLLSVGMVPKPALADDVAVTDCTRDGLAAAITDAGAGGMVTFDCNPASIIFATGDQITITQDVSIDGSNGDGDQIVLDGNEQSRFFHVTSAGSLTLANVTLKDGYGGKAGGAIRNDGGALTIFQSNFTNNHADYGGAISNEDEASIATITQSSFIENQAVGYSGGAIYSEGTLDVSQSRFAENQADVGGGIWNSGKFTISQSSFVGNQATAHAGAIDSNDGTTRILASTFSGNTAPAGSAFVTHANVTSTEIAWSTIIQPAAAGSPALYLDSDTTLIGVILGGEGDHCEFGTSLTLTNTYSLANDDSCGLGGTGSAQVDYFDGLSNLGLWPLVTIIDDGVQQSFYALADAPALDGGSIGCDTDIQAASPDRDQVGQFRPEQAACDIGAIERNLAPIMTSVTPNPTVVTINQPFEIQVEATDNAGDTLFFYIYCSLAQYIRTPDVTSSTGTFTASGTCSYSQPGDHLVRAYAIDAQNGQSVMFVARIAVQVVIPTTLCANDWNGSLRMREDCGRSETMIELPTDGPITLCVNNWNGSATLGANCSRSEYELLVKGDDSIAICVNNWNGTLRVSDQCSRSERGDML